LYINIVKIL